MFYNMSNLDIKMLYISNEFNSSDIWKHNFFVQIKFFAEHRVKKNKNLNNHSDVLQQAYMGLWEAVITYDYQKNFDFYRWAQWNISKKIRNHFRSSNRFSKIKSNIKNSSDSYDMRSKLEAKVFVDNFFEKKNKVLSEREKKVLKSLFISDQTLAKTAKSLDISTERVRQIRDHSLFKIRKYNKTY